jgi:hypothetical protein
VDALLIVGGLHRDELVRDGAIDRPALEAALSAAGAKPVAAMLKLV